MMHNAKKYVDENMQVLKMMSLFTKMGLISVSQNDSLLFQIKV
jgi:hypothetical protein